MRVEKDRSASQKVLLALWINAALFMTGFFILGLFSQYKAVVWINFIYDLILSVISLSLSARLFFLEEKTPAFQKVFWFLASFFFFLFTWFAFLAPEAGLKPLLFQSF